MEKQTNQTRRKHTEEFKKNVINLSCTSSEIIKGIAGDLGVSENSKDDSTTNMISIFSIPVLYIIPVFGF